jgi:sugar transferase (PEP-CTERM/EpsH1 system associated)
MPSAPTKILYVALDMDLGGLQRIVHLLIEGLDRTRFESYLCCFDRGGVFYDLLTGQGVPGLILHRRPGPFDAALLRNLLRFIREHRIDIIHSHNACSLYAGLAGFMAGVPVVHTDHGRLVPDKRSAIWEDWLAAHFVDAFIGVSQELTDYLASRVGISRGKLSTIINGVDTERFIPKISTEKHALREKHGIAANDLILGTVCRFDPIKNLPFMIESMPEIVSQVPRAKLIIVGEGQIQANLEKMISRLGMNKHVFLWPRRHDIEQVMPLFDVYVCTSLSEGTSMTILEAMACGLPVIASAVGGNRSLVNQDSGILVPLNDAVRYITETTELLHNASRLTMMGCESRRRVEEVFPLKQTIGRYQDLYVKCTSA